jgi:hypothetical protein
MENALNAKVPDTVIDGDFLFLSLGAKPHMSIEIDDCQPPNPPRAQEMTNASD